ncbi:hypothetical protein M1295_00655 [Patescibacteria group bacterium]|nr:hypothetical protein [Patescibacteria group bacterium]
MLNQKLGLPIKKLGIYNGGKSIKLSYDMRDSDKLLNYMYYRSFPIGLDRKAKFISCMPDYQEHALTRSR